MLILLALAVGLVVWGLTTLMAGAPTPPKAKKQAPDEESPQSIRRVHTARCASVPQWPLPAPAATHSPGRPS